MSNEEIAAIGDILERMEALDPATAEELALDRQFHMAIAEGTQSSLVAQTIQHLWDLREQSPLCRHMFDQARRGGINPRPEEHRRVFEALVRRDAEQARSAMLAPHAGFRGSARRDGTPTDRESKTGDR